MIKFVTLRLKYLSVSLGHRFRVCKSHYRYLGCRTENIELNY